MEIAQLIKIRDCISRYEWNPYHYPMQYIKLKNNNWKKLHQTWLNERRKEATEGAIAHSEESALDKIKKIIKQTGYYRNDEVVENENSLPKDKEALKHLFLDNLFQLQLQWATSTVKDVSYLDSKHRNDSNLKFFLQRFPDIYFVMYKPVFSIKHAPIDGEIVLISPVGIDVISILESDISARYLAGDERTWVRDMGDSEVTITSPLIGLKRTEHIIKSILNSEGLSLPIHKVILSKTNNIVFSSEPYNTSIVGKFQFEEWFSKKRKLTSTLKSEQLKIMEALLRYSLTNASGRPEWVDYNGGF